MGVIYNKNLDSNNIFKLYSIGLFPDSILLESIAYNEINKKYYKDLGTHSNTSEWNDFFEENNYYYKHSDKLLKNSFILSDTNTGDGILSDVYSIYFNFENGLKKIVTPIKEGNGLYNDSRKHSLLFNIDNNTIKEVNNKLYFNINTINDSENKYKIAKIDNDIFDAINGTVFVKESILSNVMFLKNYLYSKYKEMNGLYEYIMTYYNKMIGNTNEDFYEESFNVVESDNISIYVKTINSKKYIDTYYYPFTKVLYKDNYWYNKFKRYTIDSPEQPAKLTKEHLVQFKELDHDKIIYAKNLENLDFLVLNENKYFQPSVKINVDSVRYFDNSVNHEVVRAGDYSVRPINTSKFSGDIPNSIKNSSFYTNPKIYSEEKNNNAINNFNNLRNSNESALYPDYYSTEDISYDIDTCVQNNTDIWNFEVVCFGGMLDQPPTQIYEGTSVNIYPDRMTCSFISNAPNLLAQNVFIYKDSNTYKAVYKDSEGHYYGDWINSNKWIDSHGTLNTRVIFSDISNDEEHSLEYYSKYYFANFNDEAKTKLRDWITSKKAVRKSYIYKSTNNNMGTEFVDIDTLFNDATGAFKAAIKANNGNVLFKENRVYFCKGFGEQNPFNNFYGGGKDSSNYSLFDDIVYNDFVIDGNNSILMCRTIESGMPDIKDMINDSYVNTESNISVFRTSLSNSACNNFIIRNIKFYAIKDRDDGVENKSLNNNLTSKKLFERYIDSSSRLNAITLGGTNIDIYNIEFHNFKSSININTLYSINNNDIRISNVKSYNTEKNQLIGNNIYIDKSEFYQNSGVGECANLIRSNDRSNDIYITDTIFTTNDQFNGVLFTNNDLTSSSSSDSTEKHIYFIRCNFDGGLIYNGVKNTQNHYSHFRNCTITQSKSKYWESNTLYNVEYIINCGHSSLELLNCKISTNFKFNNYLITTHNSGQQNYLINNNTFTVSENIYSTTKIIPIQLYGSFSSSGNETIPTQWNKYDCPDLFRSDWNGVDKKDDDVTPSTETNYYNYFNEFGYTNNSTLLDNNGKVILNSLESSIKVTKEINYSNSSPHTNPLYPEYWANKANVEYAYGSEDYSDRKLLRFNGQVNINESNLGNNYNELIFAPGEKIVHRFDYMPYFKDSYYVYYNLATTSFVLGVNESEGYPDPVNTGKYIWIKFCKTYPTNYNTEYQNKLYDFPDDSMKYIGIATNKDSIIESDLFTDYSWYFVNADDTATGERTFTWLLYADDENGTNLSVGNPLPTSKYVAFAYNKTGEIDTNSTHNLNDYTSSDGVVWKKIKWKDGYYQRTYSGEYDATKVFESNGISYYNSIKYANQSATRDDMMFDEYDSSMEWVGLTFNQNSKTGTDYYRPYCKSHWFGDYIWQKTKNFTWIKFSNNIDEFDYPTTDTVKVGLSFNNQWPQDSGESITNEITWFTLKQPKMKYYKTWGIDLEADGTHVWDNWKVDSKFILNNYYKNSTEYNDPVTEKARLDNLYCDISHKYPNVKIYDPNNTQSYFTSSITFKFDGTTLNYIEGNSDYQNNYYLNNEFDWTPYIKQAIENNNGSMILMPNKIYICKYWGENDLLNNKSNFIIDGQNSIIYVSTLTNGYVKDERGTGSSGSSLLKLYYTHTGIIKNISFKAILDKDSGAPSGHYRFSSASSRLMGFSSTRKSNDDYTLNKSVYDILIENVSLKNMIPFDFRTGNNINIYNMKADSVCSNMNIYSQSTYIYNSSFSQHGFLGDGMHMPYGGPNNKHIGLKCYDTFFNTEGPFTSVTITLHENANTLSEFHRCTIISQKMLHGALGQFQKFYNCNFIQNFSGACFSNANERKNYIFSASGNLGTLEGAHSLFESCTFDINNQGMFSWGVGYQRYWFIMRNCTVNRELYNGKGIFAGDCKVAGYGNTFNLPQNTSIPSSHELINSVSELSSKTIDKYLEDYYNTNSVSILNEINFKQTINSYSSASTTNGTSLLKLYQWFVGKYTITTSVINSFIYAVNDLNLTNDTVLNNIKTSLENNYTEKISWKLLSVCENPANICYYKEIREIYESSSHQNVQSNQAAANQQQFVTTNVDSFNEDYEMTFGLIIPQRPQPGNGAVISNGQISPNAAVVNSNSLINNNSSVVSSNTLIINNNLRPKNATNVLQQSQIVTNISNRLIRDNLNNKNNFVVANLRDKEMTDKNSFYTYLYCDTDNELNKYYIDVNIKQLKTSTGKINKSSYYLGHSYMSLNYINRLIDQKMFEQYGMLLNLKYNTDKISYTLTSSITNNVTNNSINIINDVKIFNVNLHYQNNMPINIIYDDYDIKDLVFNDIDLDIGEFGGTKYIMLCTDYWQTIITSPDFQNIDKSKIYPLIENGILYKVDNPKFILGYHDVVDKYSNYFSRKYKILGDRYNTKINFIGDLSRLFNIINYNNNLDLMNTIICADDIKFNRNNKENYTVYLYELYITSEDTYAVKNISESNMPKIIL